MNVVAEANKFIADTRSSDYLKFTWRVPKYLRNLLSKSQLSAFEEYCQIRNIRRNLRVKKNEFPHVSDEFSLDKEFLYEVFDRNTFPFIKQDDVIFTIGSCFARNFSRNLNLCGVKCLTYGQTEDLNSPGSNQYLLKYVSEAFDADFESSLRNELDHIWSGHDIALIQKLHEDHTKQLRSMKIELRKCSKIIITLGNTIDYYTTTSNDKSKLVPKFLAMLPSEDIRIQGTTSSRLLKLNTQLRLSSFFEITRYIRNLYFYTRVVNKECDLIFSVSPVPIDNTMGMKTGNQGAVEIDCVSKCTLRAALHEVLHSDERISADKKVYYLPSFEIVRWIAPVLGVRVFGKEDAASRHVSSEILNAVGEYVYDKKSRIT